MTTNHIQDSNLGALIPSPIADKEVCYSIRGTGVVPPCNVPLQAAAKGSPLHEGAYPSDDSYGVRLALGAALQGSDMAAVEMWRLGGEDVD